MKAVTEEDTPEGRLSQKKKVLDEEWQKRRYSWKKTPMEFLRKTTTEEDIDEKRLPHRNIVLEENCNRRRYSWSKIAPEENNS